MSLLILFNQPDAVGTSSATTDGADVLGSNVAPVVATSSATTDGADVVAASVAPVVAASSAQTDGADTAAANVAPVVGTSSATTDGADVLAASAGGAAVSVSASSATTDGSDLLAANVAPLVSASAASTDGADVLASSVSARIDVASATTDGADSLAAQFGPLVSASSATTDGADVLAAQVQPQAGSVGLTAALVEGDDTLQAAVINSQAVGGFGTKAKRKFVVDVNGVITTFASAQAATDALDRRVSQLTSAEVPAAAEVVAAAPPIELPAVEVVAQTTTRYSDVLAMFDTEEEDIEFLLAFA